MHHHLAATATQELIFYNTIAHGKGLRHNIVVISHKVIAQQAQNRRGA
jgi:hypothetical protein